MATLPTRTTANTAAEHVADHNTLHGLNNQLGSFTQSVSAPGSPAAGDLWLDTDEVAQSGSSGLLKDFAFHTRTAGHYTPNSTTWVDVDSGTDLVLTAAAGDIIEVGASFVWGAEARDGYLDVASIVSAAPVNYWSGTAGGASAQGITGWKGTTSIGNSVGASVMRATVSGDISGGTITLRLRFRSNSAGIKTIGADSAVAFHWWAKNIGPQL